MPGRGFCPKKIALCGMLAAFSFSPTYTYALTPSPKEALLLRRISEYWKDADYRAVKQQLIDFLENYPDTPLKDQLYAMLGDLYFQEKEYPLAISIYEKIEDPTIGEKVRFNALQAHFEQLDYKEVACRGENWLKEKQAPGLEETLLKVRYLVAESYFRQAVRIGDEAEKARCLKQAKPHYRYLVQTKYGDRVLFPLAEIHRFLKEDARAAALYLILAEKHPEHQERFLFQAAILQIKEDHKGAVGSFKKIYELNGKRSKLSAYNLLVLYHEGKEHQEFLDFYKKVASQMPYQRRPLLLLYQAKAFYGLGLYRDSVASIEEMVDLLSGDSFEKLGREKYQKEEKWALLLMANCACHLKDGELLDRVISLVKEIFPEGAKEKATLFFAQAQIYQEQGEVRKALSSFNTFLKECPQHSQREAALYEYAFLLTQEKDFEKGKEAFALFIRSFPTSGKIVAAWRHLLNCYIEGFQVSQLSEKQKEVDRREFMALLGQALEGDQILTSLEKEKYRLVMAQCLVDLGEIDEAKPLLLEIISDCKAKDTLAAAHRLLGKISQTRQEDLSLFIEHGEKALFLDPAFQGGELLHIELYNAYLSQSEKITDPLQKKGAISAAAEHLFASNRWKNKELKKENILWLAHYFYEKGMEKEGENLYRAGSLFEAALGIDSDSFSLNVIKEQIDMEKEALKYGQLLSVQEQHQKQIVLLEALRDLQEKESGLPWKYKRKTLLDLGMAYEASGEIRSAMRLYQTLLASEEKAHSSIADTALLHLCKLQYQMLGEEKRKIEDPEMGVILHRLKDLQIQKRLGGEPIHIEAALSYAEMKIALASPEESVKKGLFLYERIKEDFSLDPFTEKESKSSIYREEKNKYPKKAHLVELYLKYIKVEMLKRQASLEIKRGAPQKGAEYRALAFNLIEALLEEKQLLRPYLIGRVNRLRVELHKND